MNRSGHKIRLISLYTLATLICTGSLVYFATSFNNLRSTRKQLNTTQRISRQTDHLITSLHAAQAFAQMYVVSRNADFLQKYHRTTDSCFYSIDLFFQELPETQQNQLLALSKLFDQKEILLQKISSSPYFPNYSNILKRSSKPVYHTENEQNTNSKIEYDTIYTGNNRGFFRRLGQLFSSSPEPDQIVTIRQKDSVTHRQTIRQVSAPDAVDTLLRTFENDRKKQIETLEKRYIALLSADQKIGQEISTLLIRLHQTSFSRVITTMTQKDRSVRQLLFAGIWSFVLVSTFVFVIFRTAQKSLRQSRELTESKRLTEELMNSQHQLLLSISHDIKAPLISILSYLEFWEKDDLSADEIRQLSSMQNSATHILDMLTNLLEFSRLEQKKTQIQNQIVEPIPLFLEIIDLFKPMAIDKNLKLLYQFTNLDHVQITIDPLKLRQIVTNLISNAIKYTIQGDIRLYAEFLDESKCLKIAVSDTGIGIPKEKSATIFDSFIQIDNRAANVEGSGLGLFVVKGLTDAMKGKISVESSEKGTVFYLEFQLSDESACE